MTLKVKKNRLHIIYSWLLLICFIAGQYVVYTHQHLLVKTTGSVYATADHSHQQQTVKEKCYLCDAMHHQAAVIDQAFCLVPQVATLHFFKASDYSFVSIALVLAAGRAPPVLS
ncbi:hypothetical protein SAMN05428975_5081 [Mucilaginibacter sp. OK268]|uniref:hypothetical protein n=1 Tax=Mucilaginibacter sp. OK268 TaxID=1881048 RepID=UPI0008924485|nr:hypothetical protein [Mucilaginibacter sp. OK268]SDP99596.1 hypothetical protein SAMN05428975_5081 [Mucilaginibacter sp. OK268]